MKYESIYDLFHKICAEHSDRVAYRFKRDGAWVDVSWSQQQEVVDRVSRALMALGIEKGDRVSILGQTRLEWVQCDFGIAGCGGVTVGIYHSNLSADCAYVTHHSDSKVIFVENSLQLEKILSARDRIPELRQIVIFDGPGDDANGVLAWDEFLALADRTDPQELERRGRSLGAEDLATLVYTSGTTGVPKGVMLTHGNLLFTTDSAGQCLYLKDAFSTLLFLPLAHVFARLITYCCVAHPVIVAFAEEITKVPENLREVRPYFLVSVPRIYEKVYDKILSSAEQAGGVRERLFHWALGVGRQVSQRQQAHQAIPLLLGLRHKLADRLVLQKIQAAFGGRLVFAVSGAAPLNKTIAEFFHACGVLILEGIGMTENTSFTNVNRIDNNKFGTVGPVGPGIEMRVADDGEVLYRGPNVMKGYFKDPQGTAEAIDADGWLHTGDIGEVDEDGFLRITDRKKDLIVTAGGKNVAPQRIERIMRTSRYIAQAVAFGDQRKYITALFTLDPEAIRAWADENGRSSVDLEQLASDPQVHALIESEVRRLNEQLASFETVKRFHILARDFSIERGELTPTLKLKRKVIVERNREPLEALYVD